ncbi:Hsp20/alpha crystallin family protein [Atopococcus tabaci]|uniref:Hsp20/alpha crystallin family protein n=1 Tax=Atopococcus tabaci TaxID=269774 RepID=UPI00240A2648|nr:Hsp20/alpha crystallin family protein [Atopococcus tabaci]
MMYDMFPGRRDFMDFSRRLFDDMFDPSFGNAAGFNTDIRETDNEYILEADLPGMAKENIHLEYHDNVLSIAAQQEEGKDETDEEGNYLRRERTSRSFRRQFLLRDVDEHNIAASFENGVLTVHLPKKEPQAPTSRRIDIQ